MNSLRVAKRGHAWRPGQMATNLATGVSTYFFFNVTASLVAGELTDYLPMCDAEETDSRPVSTSFWYAPLHRLREVQKECLEQVHVKLPEEASQETNDRGTDYLESAYRFRIRVSRSSL